MLGILQLSLLATTFTLVAGNCSVRSVQQKDRIKRCRQVRECIKEAFYGNEKNLYVIDSVFMSTQTRLPVELIIQYEVTMNRTTDEMDARNNTGRGSGLGSKSDSVSGSGHTEDDRAIGDGNLTSVTYIEDIGWSTNGIHKGIRSKVIVLLQPAYIWWTMSLAIGAYGFPETIQFEVNLTETTECDQVENITKGEVKEVLEYLTTKLHHQTTAYTWNTDMNSFQLEEFWLFALEAALTLFTTMLITVLLPRMYHGGSVRTVWMGTIIICMELFYTVKIIGNNWDNFFFSFRVNKLGWATLAFAIFGIVVGFVTSIWYRSKIKWIYLTLSFAFVYVLGAWVSANIIPILIQAFVYPTETITTIGFIMIYAIIAINGPSMFEDFINVCFKKPNKRKSKAETVLISTFPTIISMAIYGIHTLYLLLLRLLLESPTSQFTQTLLAFIPTVVAVIITYFIEKSKNKSQNKPDPPTKEDPTHTEKTNSPDNNPNDTTSEDEQPSDEQPGDEQPGDGQSRAGEMAGAESNEESQQLQVEVEVHQSDSNSSDQSIIESTV